MTPYELPRTEAAVRGLPADVRRMFVQSFRRPGRSLELTILLTALAADLEAVDRREAEVFAALTATVEVSDV